MARRATRLIPAVVTLLLIYGNAAAVAQSYQKFLGEYKGTAIVDPDGTLETRDLEVKISDTDKGFTISWVSVSRDSRKKIKRKSYTVEFHPSKRNNVYSAAMRSDMFGNRVPLDPMAGDPYVWARIEGDALIVYAMLINDVGGYEMQVYERRLTPSGLALAYSRVRDGTVLRTITAELKRTK